MRTFVIKARKGTTRWEKVRSQIGSKAHFEVIAHSVINAFFVSSDFRTNVEFYIVLDSSEDFPRTIKLSSAEGLSLSGFHENAVVEVVEKALKESASLKKDGTMKIAPGIEILGFGFERLISQFISTRPLYLLDKKGSDLRITPVKDNPVFILTDHLAMPSKSISGLKRNGVHHISLGRKMLFASQCIVLIHHELDLSAWIPFDMTY